MRADGELPLRGLWGLTGARPWGRLTGLGVLVLTLGLGVAVATVSPGAWADPPADEAVEPPVDEGAPEPEPEPESEPAPEDGEGTDEAAAPAGPEEPAPAPVEPAPAPVEPAPAAAPEPEAPEDSDVSEDAMTEDEMSEDEMSEDEMSDEPAPAPETEAAPAPEGEAAPEAELAPDSELGDEATLGDEQARDGDGEGEDADGEDAASGEDEAETGDRTPSWFIKGDLTSVGALGLVPWENRVGARIGVERLGDVFYLAATPTVNYTIEDVLGKDFLMSFGVPLRFELLDTRGATTEAKFENIMRFRTQDWDSPEDYVKLIRFLTWGRKEEHWYLNVSAFRTGTIGHGTIMKRYNPNLSIDVTRVSLELDGFSDWIGGETYLNSLGPPNMAGGLVFIKPLSLIDRDNYVMRSFSIGVSAVVDWDAPMVNKLDTFDRDGDGKRGEILLGGEAQSPEFHNTVALGWGIDAELKVFKSEDKSKDIKLYADWSTLNGQVPKACADWTTDDPQLRAQCATLFSNDPVTITPMPDEIEAEWVTSMGWSLGMLGRFTLGEERNHAVRTRIEARVYEPNYVPSYFDSFYQVQRLQYVTSKDPKANNPANQTKIRRILEREGPNLVFGGYAELSYALWETFEASIGFQFSHELADNAFFVQIGVPQFEWFSFNASFQKVSSDLDDLFTTLDNILFMAEARAQLFDFLHLNIEAITPFGFGSDNRFEQIFDINVGLELSFGI